MSTRIVSYLVSRGPNPFSLISTARNRRLCISRPLHTSPIRRDRSFTNLLADATPPPVQVSSIGEDGIRLADGLTIPAACIFLEGKVFLWDIPQSKDIPWSGWRTEQFEIFDVVIPKPGT